MADGLARASCAAPRRAAMLAGAAAMPRSRRSSPGRWPPVASTRLAPREALPSTAGRARRARTDLRLTSAGARDTAGPIATPAMRRRRATVGGRRAAGERRAAARGPAAMPPAAASPPRRHAGAGQPGRDDATAGEAGADGGARAELRSAGDEAVGDAGPEDAEAEQRECGEHQRHGIVDRRLVAAEAVRELRRTASSRCRR